MPTHNFDFNNNQTMALCIRLHLDSMGSAMPSIILANHSEKNNLHQQVHNVTSLYGWISGVSFLKVSLIVI